MTKDLTTGSPFKCIVGFATPMFLGMLFQQFYNMVDTMIVGQFLGLNPLAGVGSTSSLYFLVIGFCNGVCSGFAIPVAQAFGAKDHKSLRRLVANGALLSVLFAAVITCLTVVFCRPMLSLMNTPGNAYEYAYLYIVIIFAGIPCTFLYNMTASVIRALGDSRTPVIFLIVSSVLNIVLDLVFILPCQMNVAGAALATVISQGVSGLVCLIYAKKKFPILRLEKGEGRPDKFSIVWLCRIGLPMGLQYSITAIGTIVVQAAVNAFGEVAVAGVAAAQKISGLLTCPLEALGATMATYTGQNMGAGRLDRVSRGLFLSTLSGIVVSAVTLVVVLLFGNQLSLLFISSAEAEALDYSFHFLLISAATYALLTLVLTVRYTIQGMGYSTFAMIAGFLEMAARCFVGLVLPLWLGFTGVCFSNPAAWIAADLFLIPAFFFCRRRLSRTMPQRSPEAPSAS